MRLIVLVLIICSTTLGYAQEHKMQHGFILGKDDIFATHLVANGHHSRQVSLIGKLTISDALENEQYIEYKKSNIPLPKDYFIFQAQRLALPQLKAGQVLKGHIIKSKIGEYEADNIIVKEAIFQVNHIFINIVNPFFL